MASDAHRQASISILSTSQTLAQASVALQYQLQPAEWLRFEGKFLDKSLRDTVYHLNYLAQALALETPQIFIDYSFWCQTLFDGLGFSAESLPTTLRCIRHVLEEHLPAAESAVANAIIAAALEQLPAARPISPNFLHPEAPLYDLAQAFLRALLRKDQSQARALIMNAAQGGTNLQAIYLHVFQPCLRELGRMWHLNQINIAQEHYATAVTQIIMAQLYPYMFANAPATKRGKVVVACVSGELHELGARMLADFFEMESWDSFFLGANTPATDIIQTITIHRVPLLCLSVTAAPNIVHAAELITLLRASPVGQQTRVLVGGYPFNQIPDLWRKIGADGYAPDAQTALEIARQLINEEAKQI